MDIRLVRGRSHRLWVWTGVLVGLSAIVYAAALLLGDPTTRPGRAAGASANFGAERGAVVPVRAAPFEDALPLQDRELGRLLRVRGTADSRLSAGSLWVRTLAGQWILLRFEPMSPAVGPYYRGSAVDVVGYLEKISRPEFDAWLDSLQVYLPRPKPGVKFGDLPDSGFIKVDALFIRDYYVSVRPEGARRGAAAEAAANAPAAPVASRESPKATTGPAREPPRSQGARQEPAEEPRRAPAERVEPNDTRPSVPPEPGRPPQAPRDSIRLR